MHYLKLAVTDTATTDLYTLSLHDALPILRVEAVRHHADRNSAAVKVEGRGRIVELVHAIDAMLVNALRCHQTEDRKSTRLNSSHPSISYAVFCLKKKKKNTGNRH